MKKVYQNPLSGTSGQGFFLWGGKNPKRTPARFLHRLKEDRKVFCPSGKYRRCFV